MSSKTFEQLMTEINANVEQENFQKQASKATNLSDLWLQANGVQTDEEEGNKMYEFNKLAAAQNDALDTMCVFAARDLCFENINKQASMNKDAGQRLVISHCMRFGWSPEQCIHKEASNRVVGELSNMIKVGTDAYWQGFMKAAADDATPGPASGPAGPSANNVTTDQPAFRAQAPSMNVATGAIAPIDGSGTIDSMIAKVLSGAGSNYGHQGVLNHNFLPKA